MGAKGKTSLTSRVLSAVAMLGSAQVVNIACSVVRTKLIAVWLGPIGVGLNTILVNGSALVSTTSQLNIRESSVRDLSAPSTADALTLKTAAVRRWALILGLLGALAMIVLSPLLSASAYSGSTEYSLYFAALAPGVFAAAYAAGEFAVMQARGQLGSIARANAAGGVAATLVSLPLLYIFRINAIVAVINIYSIAIALCAFFWRIRPDRKPAKRLDLTTLWSQGRSFLILGLSISASAMLTTLMNYIFSAYVNSRSGETALGIYQSGYTLVNSYVGIIFSAIAVEYYPRLTGLIGRRNMARTIMAHEVSLVVKLITPVALIFISMSDIVARLLYSSDFSEVVPFITFAIIGAVFRGVSLCYAYRILAAGDSRAYIFSETVSVTVGLALNIIAYSSWSYLGLGLSYIAWYIFYTALTAVICRHRYGVILPRRLWVLTAISVAVISAAIALKMLVAWWLPLVTLLPAVIVSTLLLQRK